MDGVLSGYFLRRELLFLVVSFEKAMFEDVALLLLFWAFLFLSYSRVRTAQVMEIVLRI